MSQSPLLAAILVSIATVIDSTHAQPVWPRAEPTEPTQHTENPKPTAKETPTHKAPSTTQVPKQSEHSPAATKTKETSFSNAIPSSTAAKSTTKKQQKPHTSTSSTADPTSSISPTIPFPIPVVTDSSTLMPTATSSNDVVGSAANQTGSSSSGPSGGAIGGIVAAVIIAVGGLAAFVMVKRKKKRSRRMTKPDPFTMGFGSHDPPPALDNNFPPHAAYASMNTVQTPQAQLPPITTATSPPPPYPQMAAATVMAAAPTPQPDSIGVFTVISTYTPTLNDEIDIQTGDRVEVLVEYDDGWCQGINLSRGNAKGVFPKHCVDYATAPSEHDKSQVADETDRVKRVSSMYMTQNH
ncbi:hypothetical protein DFQ28_005460 [Apophysomyces sp. BC1034]|nr:hypothetical protein DFQ30_005579 [Apophysomyces sp. BC1015]KAG0188053.1 hypothetical protein DFQ28_005460 [Apophysomyces sp. BC1034]